MTYEIVRSHACDRDLELIFDYLVETYEPLGDSAGDALDRAGARVRTTQSVSRIPRAFMQKSVTC